MTKDILSDVFLGEIKRKYCVTRSVQGKVVFSEMNALKMISLKLIEADKHDGDDNLKYVKWLAVTSLEDEMSDNKFDEWEIFLHYSPSGKTASHIEVFSNGEVFYNDISPQTPSPTIAISALEDMSYEDGKRLLLSRGYSIRGSEDDEVIFELKTQSNLTKAIIDDSTGDIIRCITYKFRSTVPPSWAPTTRRASPRSSPPRSIF